MTFTSFIISSISLFIWAALASLVGCIFGAGGIVVFFLVSFIIGFFITEVIN